MSPTGQLRQGKLCQKKHCTALAGTMSHPPKPLRQKRKGAEMVQRSVHLSKKRTKSPQEQKTVENPSSDLCPTGAEDCKALCKRGKSAPTTCTTNAAAEADVVKEKQSHGERQASGAPSRKSKFKRRTLSDKRLIQEFPWAGDRQPKSLEESRQISIDMARLRNMKKKI